MLKKFLNIATRLLQALVLTSSLGYTFAAQNSEADVTVPKGIQDIVNLIKQTAGDTKSRDADIKLISEKVPAGATAQDKYVFYLSLIHI